MKSRESVVPDYEKFRKEAHADWDDAARVAAWRKWHAKFAFQTRAATEAIVKAAQAAPGLEVLDLACGSGEPAITLAKAVAPGGRVTATDMLPGMLATAGENARREGLANITFSAADAEDLPFSGASFDAVTCRFGIMFVPDAVRALREVRRVLRPGGRPAFIAWGPREQNSTYIATWRIVNKYAPSPDPEPGAPEGYRFAQPGSLSAVFREAGFQKIKEECLSVPWPWPGPPEEFWESHRDLRGTPFRRVLDRVPPEKLPQMMDEVHAAIAAYFDGRQVNFTAKLVLCSLDILV